MHPMNPLSKLFGGKKPPETTDVNPSHAHPTPKPTAATFAQLVERHAGLSYEKQHLLSDLIGASAWQLDMATGDISFGDIRLPIQIIGSLAFAENSWMWAWANTASGMPEALLVQSHRLRELGEARGITELTQPNFAATPGIEHRIGMLAAGEFGASSYYSANYGKGTLVVTIDSDQIAKVDPDAVPRVATIFPQLISAIELDHRNALIN